MLYGFHEGIEAKLGGARSDWSSLEVLIGQGVREIPLDFDRQSNAYGFSSKLFLIEEVSHAIEIVRAVFYISDDLNIVFRGNMGDVNWLSRRVGMFKDARPGEHEHIDSISFESVLDSNSLDLVLYMEEEL